MFDGPWLAAIMSPYCAEMMAIQRFRYAKLEMTLIPLAARLAPLDEEINAPETVRRIETTTLQATIDWNEADAEVHRGLERLQKMEMPDCYLEAKRKSFGKVAYISLTDDAWPGQTASFYASDIKRDLGECYDLHAQTPFSIPFLIHVASNLCEQLGFEYLLSAEQTWGIEIRSEPAERDPYKFVRERLPERNYPELSLSELPDWRSSLLRAIPLWFEQATVRNKEEMIRPAGSVEAVARETVDALMAIGTVCQAWNVILPVPFLNGLVLEQEGWTSFLALRTAPTGILS